MVWAVLLPYLLRAEYKVSRHFLPRYIPSLQYARIPLLGIPFLAAIQILQSSYAYLIGAQKKFMTWTGVALSVEFRDRVFRRIPHGFTADRGRRRKWRFWVHGGLFNECALRRLTGETVGDWLRFLGIYALASGSYWMASA